MRILLALLFGCLALPALAEDPVLDAMNRFDRLANDDALRERSYAAGHERIRFCSYCHGEDGTSKRDDIPNLAAQNPIYLFRQFEKFASGERKDYVMSQLANDLTLDDRVDIAMYYSRQTVRPGAASDAALLQSGRSVYERICFSCHGAHGEGMESMPRLAGQPETYIRTALTRFRDKDPARANSPMLGIASMLSDRDIDAVAAYVRQLPD